MAQGITHGIIRMASGGKFINGFLSAVASKTSSAILKQTPLFARDNFLVPTFQVGMHTK